MCLYVPNEFLRDVPIYNRHSSTSSFKELLSLIFWSDYAGNVCVLKFMKIRLENVIQLLIFGFLSTFLIDVFLLYSQGNVDSVVSVTLY